MARSDLTDPADFVSILGQTFVKREHTPLLKIGALTWDRWALGRLGCPHPVAALRLNRVVQELGIRTIPGLARAIHEVGNFKGCGTTVYYTVLAILREHGIDAEAAHGEPVTFSTLKTRATKAARKRPAKRPRQAGPPSEAAGATP
jgi:hypothetical protein